MAIYIFFPSPDIPFAVSTLSQFLDNPGSAHWEAIDVCRRKGRAQVRRVFITDADGASQEHRHAISSHAFLLDGGAVSWSSRKQELVTLSTAKAEYVAATHAAKEDIWLRNFIGEVFAPFTERQLFTATELTKNYLKGNDVIFYLHR